MCLAASMRTQLDALERHGELSFGQARYSSEVRAELLAMSAAMIDRYLAPAKDAIGGVSTTKPSPLLRSSITIRNAGDEVEAEPGFFEGDTVAHCGPTLKGEFARTLNLTDVRTGWVFTRSVRSNANTHILSALQAAIDDIPGKASTGSVIGLAPSAAAAQVLADAVGIPTENTTSGSSRTSATPSGGSGSTATGSRCATSAPGRAPPRCAPPPKPNSSNTGGGRCGPGSWSSSTKPPWPPPRTSTTSPPPPPLRRPSSFSDVPMVPPEAGCPRIPPDLS